MTFPAETSPLVYRSLYLAAMVLSGLLPMLIGTWLKRDKPPEPITPIIVPVPTPPQPEPPAPKPEPPKPWRPRPWRESSLL